MDHPHTVKVIKQQPRCWPLRDYGKELLACPTCAPVCLRHTGDYEYYYEDGRPPVPAPPKPQQPAGSPSAAPLPPTLVPVPILVTPLPPPAPNPPDVTAEEPYEDEIEGEPQPAPPGLPQVFGPEPIPEAEPQIPVPPPTPIALTSPAPPKDTKGTQDKFPIPRVPVRVPPPAPPPAPARSTVRPPAPTSALPDVAGVHAGHVQAPKPWVLKQEGASKTILIGCILPFEGDLQIAGTSIYHALKLAVSDEAPKVLPRINVNVTCINTKCADIAAHMAMSRFAKEKAGNTRRPAAGICNMQPIIVQVAGWVTLDLPYSMQACTVRPSCMQRLTLRQAPWHQLSYGHVFCASPCASCSCRRWRGLFSRHSGSSRCFQQQQNTLDQPSSHQPSPIWRRPFLPDCSFRQIPGSSCCKPSD